MMNLEGKVALVTGASRGIGRAIAELLVERGAKVIGTATSEGGAAAISEYLGENGKGLALNVTDVDSIAATLKTINDEFGAIDILVNNAGITRDNLLMRMKDDEWNDIIDTNLTPIFRMSKAVLRGMMKKRQGRIVNVGSVVGTMGNAGQANYAAAKAGVIGFTKSMAREVASRGVTLWINHTVEIQYQRRELRHQVRQRSRIPVIRGLLSDQLSSALQCSIPRQ